MSTPVLDARKMYLVPPPVCICGLDTSANGFRFDIVCPKHDADALKQTGRLVHEHP